MSAFDFVFSFFGLLLGFSLAEVLGGLVRVVQARRSVRIGWLTPMLELIVMLDLTTFWSIAWVFRDKIPPALLTLVVGLWYPESTISPRRWLSRCSSSRALIWTTITSFIAGKFLAFSKLDRFDDVRWLLGGRAKSTGRL